MIKSILQALDTTKKMMIIIMATIITLIHMVTQKNIGKKKVEKNIIQKKMNLNIQTKTDNIIKILPIKILIMIL